ncbi:MAG: response regulator [Chloroflexi bacterium]|nr:response regulator [Chloroflexota bacterium]
MKEKTILLVDDNEHDVFLIQRALKKSNMVAQVVVAWDGDEALDYLFGTGKYAGRNLNDTPELTLLDLKMPRVNGFEVLKRVRADLRTKYLPVVILTASKEEVDIANSYAMGANAYVGKPVDFDEFAEAVYRLGLFWLDINESPPIKQMEEGHE